LGLGFDEFGLKLDRDLYFFNGLLRLSHLFQHASQIEMGLCVLRGTLSGALQQDERFVHLFLLPAHHSEMQGGLDEVWLQSQSLGKLLGGLVRL
jgi:hypothetical protein